MNKNKLNNEILYFKFIYEIYNVLSLLIFNYKLIKKKKKRNASKYVLIVI